MGGPWERRRRLCKKSSQACLDSPFYISIVPVSSTDTTSFSNNVDRFQARASDRFDVVPSSPGFFPPLPPGFAHPYIPIFVTLSVFSVIFLGYSSHGLDRIFI